MDPETIALITTTAVAAGSAALNVLAFRGLRKARASRVGAQTEKTCAEADMIAVKAAEHVVQMLQAQVTNLMNEVAQVRATNQDLARRVNDCEKDRADLHRQVEALNAKVAQLERTNAAAAG